MERKRFARGVHFNPSDEELAVEYLDKKLKKQPLPSNAVKECYHVYGDKYPWEMLDQNSNDDLVCFFTKLKRVGRAIPRSAGPSGVWKYMSATRAQNADGSIQWCRRDMVFVFAPSSARHPVHGNWFMQEFSLLNQTVNDFVLCKISKIPKDPHKKRGSRKNPISILDGSDEVEVVIAPSEDDIQCNHELPAANTSNVLAEERRRSGESVPSRAHASYQKP